MVPLCGLNPPAPWQGVLNQRAVPKPYHQNPYKSVFCFSKAVSAGPPPAHSTVIDGRFSSRFWPFLAPKIDPKSVPKAVSSVFFSAPFSAPFLPPKSGPKPLFGPLWATKIFQIISVLQCLLAMTFFLKNRSEVAPGPLFAPKRLPKSSPKWSKMEPGALFFRCRFFAPFFDHFWLHFGAKRSTYADHRAPPKHFFSATFPGPVFVRSPEGPRTPCLLIF